MSIAVYAIQKKTVTWVMTFVLLIGGALSFQGLSRLEDPEFSIKDAVVVTAYPGASPEEVEREVTDVIETEIQRLSQLDSLESISKAGLSTITVSIQDSYDKEALPAVWEQLRRKINDVQPKLPPGVGVPKVIDDFGDVFGLLYAITGDGYSFQELNEFAKLLKKELLLVDGVAKIDLWGVQDEAIYVEFSTSRMSQLGIRPAEIAQALSAQNTVVAAGNVLVGDELLRIDSTGAINAVEDISNLIIRKQDGKSASTLIYLKDIAEVKREYIQPASRLLLHNGVPAISLGASVVSGGNVVDMGYALQTRLDEIMAATPIGLEVHPISLQHEAVTLAIDNFLVSLQQAVAIVVVVLLLFMGFRSGLIIGAVLLVTVVGTFILMDLEEVALQRISLGALVIALGMLVDNAIVVTEGMLVKIKAGADRLSAAREVVAQTMWPLLGATVIAILAFAAIGVSQDSTGEFCRSLFQVMMFSLLLSWVTAITVTPLFCAAFLPGPKADDSNGGAISDGTTDNAVVSNHERSGNNTSDNKTSSNNKNSGDDAYSGAIFVAYRNFLATCIRFRWFTLVFMVALLFASIWGFMQLKGSFFPASTMPKYMLHYWLPQGTDIRTTQADVEKISAYLLQDERIDYVDSFIGAGAPRFILTYSPEKDYSSYAFIMVSVKNYEDINDLMIEQEAYIQQNYPDALPRLQKFALGPSPKNSVEARFSGPDPVVLRQLSEQAKAIYREAGGLVVKDDWREKVKKIRPVFSEQKANFAGVTRSDLNKVLQAFSDGAALGIYREGDELLPIYWRASPQDRQDVSQLRNLQVWSAATGQVVPIEQVVSDFKVAWEDALIIRRDRTTTITAGAEPPFGKLPSELFSIIRNDIESIPLPDGYNMEWGGEFEGSSDAQAALAGGLPISIALMILISIVLFNNLRMPLIIWLTVPLAIIGVAWGLLGTNQSFGFMPLLGFLSLTGMLIKNAIVLLDEINVNVALGKEPLLATLDSAVSRARPVMMAAGTTVLGMIPLLADDFFIGMAVTIMAGLTFASILTLIVVPVLYTVFYRVKYA